MPTIREYSTPADNFLEAEVGVWTFVVVAIGLNGKSSLPAQTTYTLSGWAGQAATTVAGLSVKGGGSTFTGRSCTVAWTNQIAASVPPYPVRNAVYVFDASTQAMVHREVLPAGVTEWTYDYFLNVNEGGPRRQFRVGVTAYSAAGDEGPPSYLTVSNPAPEIIVPTLGSTSEVLFVDLPKVADADFAGYLVWVSETPNINPLTAPSYDVAGNSFPYRGVPDKTYYVRAAAYDAFSKDPAQLNVSAEQSKKLTIQLFDPLAPPIPGTPTLASNAVEVAPDGTVTARVIINWPVVSSTNLGTYEVAIAEGNNPAESAYVAGRISAGGPMTFAGLMPGRVYTIKVRSNPKNGFANSGWSPVLVVTAALNPVAPANPTGLSVSAAFQRALISLTPPANKDLAYIEVWAVNSSQTAASPTTGAVVVGRIPYGDMAFWDNLPTGGVRTYWLRSVNTSGVVATGYVRAGTATTAAILGAELAAGIIDETKIASSLALNKTVASLPATKGTDYVTFNGEQYRWDVAAGQYTKAVLALDISGKVAAAQIDTVAAAQITGQLQAAQVAALEASKITGQMASDQIASLAAAKIAGQLTSAQIGAGTVSFEKFASGLSPIVDVSALPNPTGYTGSKVVRLTTDGKLYRLVGTAWTAGVAAGDITGTVAAAQIAGLEASKITGQLSDGQLAAISAAKISGTLTSAQIASLDAAKIAGTLAVGNIPDFDAAKIVSGTLGDARIASGISAAKIAGALANATLATTALSGTIVDSQIANGVSAAKITGALTGATLAAASLTGKITETQISDNAISTPMLKAGAVVTAALAANSVTASKMVLSDPQNLCLNPSFAQGWEDWVRSSTALTFLSNAASGDLPANAPAQNAVKLVRAAATPWIQNDASNGSAVRGTPAGPGDAFYFEAMVYADVAASLVLQPIGYRTDGVGAGGSGPTVAIPAGVWTKISGTVIMPALTVTGCIRINSGINNSTVWLTNIRWQRKNGAELIVDGSISARKLMIGATAANLISAGEFLDGLDSYDKGETANFIIGRTGGPTGGNYLRLSRNGVTTSVPSLNVLALDFTPIEGGAIYEAACYIRANMNATTGFRYRLLWFDDNKVATTAPGTGGAGISNAYTDVWNNTQAFTTSWVQISRQITPPATARYFKFQAYHHTEGGADWLDIANVSLRKAMTATTIADGAITTGKVAANTITAAHIVAGTITATELAANSITTAKIVASAVTADQIATNAVVAAKISADAVTAGKIAANAITAREIVAGTITATEIAANAITATHILAGTITATELAANSVTTAKIATNAVTANEIAAATITTTEIATGAIVAAKIAAGAIDATKIAADAVTAGKVAANAITAREIVAATITATEIATGAITADKILANAVISEKIAANAITGQKLAISSANAAFNPDFGQGQRGWSFAGISAPGGAGSAVIENVTDHSFAPAGMTAIRTRTTANPTATTGYYDILSSFVQPDGSSVDYDVVAGQIIELSAYISAHRCSARFIIQWFNASGAAISETAAGNTVTGGYASTMPLAIWDADARLFTLATAPANATKLRVRIRAFNFTANTGVAAYVFVSGLMIAPAYSATQTSPSPYAAPGVTTIDGSGIITNSITTRTLAANAVTANEIAANAVVAAKIQAGAIQTNHMTAGTIQADRLVAQSITAGLIAGSTITGDKIAGRTISAGNIVTGTLTGNEIQANSVNADRLVANSITTAQIAAGAIKTAQLDAGAITADKLGVGLNTGNLIWNSDREVPGFLTWSNPSNFAAVGEGGSDWCVSGVKNFTFFKGGTNPTDQLAYADLLFPTANGGTSNIWPVQAGQTYEWTCYISAHRCRGYIEAHWWNGSQYNLAGYGSTIENVAGTTVPADNWRARMKMTAPGDAQGVVLRVVFVTNKQNDAYMVASAPYLGLVPPGTPANVYSAYAPQSRTIISGGQVATNTLHANRITAGTITTDRVATGGLHADRIQSGTITTTQIQAGGINADRIQASTITSTQIAANAISASRLNIEARGITPVNVYFEMERDGNGNATGWLKWTAGQIEWIDDNGNRAFSQTPAGRMQRGSDGWVTVWFDKASPGMLWANSGNNIPSIRANPNCVLVATSADLTGVIVNWGGTVIDGDKIVANSIQARNIAANQIQTQHMAANSINGDRIIAGSLSADRISAGTINTGTINIGSGACIIDSWSRMLRMFNEYSGVEQVSIGQVGRFYGYPGDAGIVIRNGQGGEIFRVSGAGAWMAGAIIGDAEITNAKIQNLTIGNEKVQNDAITNGAASIGGAFQRDREVFLNIRRAGTRVGIWVSRTGNPSTTSLASSNPGLLRTLVARPGQGWGDRAMREIG